MLEWVYNVSIQAVNLSCVAVFKCVYASLSMHYLLHYCCVAATASESHTLECGCVEVHRSHRLTRPKQDACVLTVYDLFWSNLL